jgi:predicted amidohydrolase YtcJ
VGRDRFDTVYVGGRAFTSGWQESRPLGVAVSGGRIMAVDTDDRLRGAGATEVVDLRGGLLLPAFHDAHAHPVAGGIELLQCDVSPAADAADCLRRIGDYARTHPEVAWIQGGGWSMSHFPGGAPTAAQLDAVVPDRPVVLSNRDHHGLWLNSAALREAGITVATPDPPDGRLERNADGSPAGVLHEGAMRLVDGIAPGTSAELALAGLERAQLDFFALGVAGWQDAWVGATAGLDDLLDTYLLALDRGVLRARVTAALWWERERGLEQIDGLRARRARVAGRGRPDVLVADTVKIMVDGVAENFTAAMSAPYLDGHGHATANRGLTFLEPDALRAAAVLLAVAGFHLHFHALGDRAVTVTLDAIEAARAAHPATSTRHQLAHLQIVDPSDIPRFAELGAIANLQMLWGELDDQVAELTLPFLTPELFATRSASCGMPARPWPRGATGPSHPPIRSPPCTWRSTARLRARPRTRAWCRRRPSTSRPRSPPTRQDRPTPAVAGRTRGGCGRGLPPTSSCSMPTRSGCRRSASTRSPSVRRGSTGRRSTRRGRDEAARRQRSG